MNKRAGLYGRVSTEEQGEKGYSIPSQIEAGKAYAASKGFDLVGVFVDEYSGAVLERPELSKLREMVRARALDVVIVYSSDRLARSLAHWLILRGELRECGVELHFVQRGKSEETPEARMFENIEGVFSEYEREKIKERMIRGRMQKAKQGKYVRHGKPPYGYHVENGNLAIYEPEADIVRKIYEWKAYGDEDKPMPIRAIARRLSNMRVPSPSDSAQTKHKRYRVGWSQFTVYYILCSETYKGIFHYRRHIGRGGKEGYRPVSEHILINCPAIVDGETWSAASRAMQTAKKLAERRLKNDFLLRGFIRCGVCGTSVNGKSRYRQLKSGEQVIRTYYRCSRHARRMVGIDPKGCAYGYIRSEKLDALVWQIIVNVLTGDGFENTLREAQLAEKESIAPRREELAGIEKQISKCKAEAANLAASLGRAGRLMHEAIQSRIDSVEKNYLELIQRRDELTARIESANIISEDELQETLKYRREVLAGIAGFTFDERRRVVELLGTKVTLLDKSGEVSLKVPTSSMCFELGISPPQEQQRSQNRRW